MNFKHIFADEPPSTQTDMRMRPESRENGRGKTAGPPWSGGRAERASRAEIIMDRGVHHLLVHTRWFVDHYEGRRRQANARAAPESCESWGPPKGRYVGMRIARRR